MGGMRNFIALVSMAALALAGGLPAGADDNVGGTVFALNAQSGSGQYGTVALKARGSKTVIEVHLLGAPASEPAQIQNASCGSANPSSKYTLTPLTNGISETTVDAPSSALTAGGLAVTAETSADVKTQVACGNL
jgi:hypothetical protein